MRELKGLFLLIWAGLVFGQYEYLDPANYPNDMKCDTTGMVAEFNQHWQGTLKYKVYLPPVNPNNPDRYLSPVIDGTLESEIWSFADTLVINSWEMAGFNNACNDGRFYGAEDLHVVWRFLYNHDGLFVSAQVHDDIHDVDSLKGWFVQDGCEIMIDPWDWGDFAAGNWTADPPVFRRYYSGMGQVLPGGTVGDDNSHLAYFHLIKRLNEEPYLTGLLHGVWLANYGKGQEATNFTKGNPNCMGVDFAVAYQGVDDYFREVYHAEFLFPYPTTQASHPSDLWAALNEGAAGFFDNDGLPKGGILFKMAMWSNDDDILGPDGSNPNFNQNGPIRRAEFHQEASGHDHWSDTKYYMTFEYQPYIGALVAVPFSGDKGHGDGRITGPWISVDAQDTNRYLFTGGGTIKLDGSTYFYDYVDTNGGAIKSGANTVATYDISLNAANKYKDTLVITGTSINKTLIRFLATGWTEVEGRWIESQLIQHSAMCSSTTYWKYAPIPNARELRFVPASRFTDAGYEDAVDSVRIYNNGVTDTSYAYTADAAVIGRDNVVFSYKLTKLLDLEDNTAPVQLVVVSNGDTAIFQKMSTWALYQIGATKMNIGTLVEYMVYPDMLVRVVDSNKAANLTPAFLFSSSVDSFAFVSYDASTTPPTGTGEYRHDSISTWADSSWVVTTRYLYISDLSGGTDTFYFLDTIQVQTSDPYSPNYVSPACQISVEGHGDAGIIEMAIAYEIPGQKTVQAYTIGIYNIKGQLVRTLVKGKVKNGYRNKVVWNGMDNTGAMVASGLYFYRLSCGNLVKKGSMVIVK